MKKLLGTSILITLIVLGLQLWYVTSPGYQVEKQMQPFATLIFSNPWVNIPARAMYNLNPKIQDVSEDFFTFFPALHINLINQEDSEAETHQEHAWLAFTIYSYSHDFFILLTDRQNHEISEMVVVWPDGTRAKLRGKELSEAEQTSIFPRMQGIKLNLTEGSPATIYLQVMHGNIRNFNISLLEKDRYVAITHLYMIITTLSVGAMLLMLIILLYIKVRQRLHKNFCLAPFVINLIFFCILSLPELSVGSQLRPVFIFIIPALALMISSANYRQACNYLAGINQNHSKRQTINWKTYIVAAISVYIITLILQLRGNLILADLLVIAWMIVFSVDALLGRETTRNYRVSVSVYALTPLIVILTSLVRVMMGYSLFSLFDIGKFPMIMLLHNSLIFAAALRRLHADFNNISDHARSLKSQLERLRQNQKEQNSLTNNILLNSLHGIMDLLDDNSETDSEQATKQTAMILKRELGAITRFLANIQNLYEHKKDTELQVSKQNISQAVNASIKLASYLSSNQLVNYFVKGTDLTITTDLNIFQKLLTGLIYREDIFTSISRIDLTATKEADSILIQISNNGETELIQSTDHLKQDSKKPQERLAAILGPNLAESAALLEASVSWNRTGDVNHYVLELPIQLDSAVVIDVPGHEITDFFGTDRTARYQQYLAAEEALPKLSAVIKKRAVLVIDEPVSLFASKRRLERSNWQVHSFLSPSQALASLALIPDPDILLLEASMHDMTGYELCSKIRHSYQQKKWPIIIIINNNTAEQIRQVFQSGANDYLIRPFSESDLIARLSTHTELAASLQRELQQKSRMVEIEKIKSLSWLTAGLAHEINTPNNSILRNVPVLREIWTEIANAMDTLYQTEGNFNIRGFSFNDLQTEIPAMLADIYTSAQHIRKIVQELKEFSGGTAENRFECVDLNQAVSYAVRLLRHAIANSSTRFSLNLTTTPLPVTGDKLKLAQVVVNIVENSLQALEKPDASISVSSRLEPAGPGSLSPTVVLEIRDEGCGMTEESLKSVFDPFYTTKRGSGGTGMGMPVVSGIIREHKGDIEIQSEPGKGTITWIRLPVCEQSEKI